MSWDIFIQDLPPVSRVEDIPPDFRPRCIGERDAIVATMAEQQDNDWLFVKGVNIDLSLQLHMEDAVQVRYIVLHVEGGSQSAPAVATLLRQLGLRALDTATGDLFDAETLEEGL